MSIAKRIFDLRKKAGLSQEDLANKCNVSRQAVSKWESEQAMPDIEKILQMCEVFGVSTDYLLKGNVEDKTRRGINKSEILGYILLGLSAISTLVLLIIASVIGGDCYIESDNGTWFEVHGIMGFLKCYNLEWLLWILVTVGIVGIILIVKKLMLRQK